MDNTNPNDPNATQVAPQVPGADPMVTPDPNAVVPAVDPMAPATEAPAAPAEGVPADSGVIATDGGFTAPAADPATANPLAPADDETPA